MIATFAPYTQRIALLYHFQATMPRFFTASMAAALEVSGIDLSQELDRAVLKVRNRSATL